MPLIRNTDDVCTPRVTNWEDMLALIHQYGIVPFFVNPIPGYSIEEHTPPPLWFTSDNLGPWDWKIECLQNGDIAYGKYVWGGKAVFATVDVYRELMNWRRSQPKYRPAGEQQKIMNLVYEQGSVTVADVRNLLGVNKAKADTILAKLQMQTQLITGDISRVYSGPDLHYAGWQKSTFCTPEALFEELDIPIPGYKPRLLKSKLKPEESLEFLKDTVRSACGKVDDKLLMKMFA